VKSDRDNKAPGFWFYPGDYERDVQVLSLPAQGLWMRMICWAGSNEAHRGFIELQSGEPMTEEDIAAKVGRPIKAVRECLAEMKRVGIFSVDSRGCIFNRRMARESTISDARKRAADSRWNKAQLAAGLHGEEGKFAYAKGHAKKMQKAAVTASASDPVSTTAAEAPEIAFAYPKSQAAVAERFRLADSEITKRIAAAAIAVRPNATDEEIAEAIRNSGFAGQKSAAGYLKTVPAYLQNARPRDAPDTEAEQNRAFERARELWRSAKTPEQRAEVEAIWPVLRSHGEPDEKHAS
jgi:hypothetical protein